MNQLIIDQFKKLIDQTKGLIAEAELNDDQKEVTKQNFRMSSFKKVLGILKKVDFEITKSSDLKGINGIGKGTLERIDQILTEGSLSELKSTTNLTTKSDQSEKLKAIAELESVIGIGSKIARDYVMNEGIMSIKDLKNAIKKGDLEVNDKIKLGLKYHGVVQTNIPRSEIKEIESYLLESVKQIDQNLKLIICGSYRRGKPTSGDIDVLIYHPDIRLIKHTKNPKFYDFPSYLEKLVTYLTKKKFIIDHLTDKNYVTKYMGFCKFEDNPVRRIDIRMIPFKSIAAAKLYFTGPYELNTYMRTLAKKRNMILNEYGIYNVDKKGRKTFIKTKREKDIFNILGMEYLTPQEREQFSVGKKSNKF